MSSGPNRNANARCCSSSMCWSRKKMTRWSSSSRRSTPWTSAPMVAVTGRISMLTFAPRSAEPAITSRPEDSCARRPAMAASPRFSHLDDMKWQDVRSVRQGDRVMFVREKWLDFSPEFLSLYAKWDPGMIVQPHGHNSNHVVFVLEGEMTCGDVACTKG